MAAPVTHRHGQCLAQRHGLHHFCHFLGRVSEFRLPRLSGASVLFTSQYTHVLKQLERLLEVVILELKHSCGVVSRSGICAVLTWRTHECVDLILASLNVLCELLLYRSLVLHSKEQIARTLDPTKKWSHTYRSTITAWKRDLVAPMDNEATAEVGAQAQISGVVAESSGAQARLSGAVAELSAAQAQSGTVAEPRRDQAQSGTMAAPSPTIVRRLWPGKWGNKAEVVVPNLAPVPEGGDVEMDPALWGELQRHVNMEEMVVAKLPLHAFYRARSVCKKWNGLPWKRPFLEKHSTTSLPRPYFVLHGHEGCHQAILVKDVMREKWVMKPLPAFAFHHTHTSLDRGVVSTCTDEGNCDNFEVRGTVFNMDTKVFRRLPPLTVLSGYFEFAEIAVDECSGSYKMLLAERDGSMIWVFDSVTGGWSAKAAPPTPFCYVEDSTHCDGVMYIKWRGDVRGVTMPPHMQAVMAFARGPPVPFPGPPDLVDDLMRFDPLGHPAQPPRYLLRAQRPKMFAYNFRDDMWTELPMAPPPLLRVDEDGWQELFVLGLGEWRGALRDVTFRSADNLLRLWEFDQSRQKWLEMDRMPASILEWFLDPPPSVFVYRARKTIKTSYCEHYILMWNHGFPRASGVARLVLYDMALKSWEPIEVAKDWICSDCPFYT